MMRFLSLVLLMGLLSCGHSESNKAFYDAVALYESEKYDEALLEFLKLESENKHSAELSYNIANCYYHKDSLAQSIYYYQKALKERPSFNEARHNYAIAYQKITQKAPNYPELFYQRWARKLVHLFSANGWAIVIVLLFWIAFISFVLYLRSANEKKQKLYFYAALVGLIAGLVCIVPAFGKYQFEKKEKRAVLFAEEYNFKKSPSIQAETVFTLSAGNFFDIVETLDGWARIRLQNGDEAWIEEDFIKKI